MDRATKTIEDVDLHGNVRGHLDQLGISPATAVPLLLAISRTYADRVVQRGKAGTRGALLIELRELRERPQEKRALRLGSISEMAVRSLCGVFPSSTLAFHDFGGGGGSFPVMDDLQVLVSAFKNDIAHRAVAGGVLLSALEGRSSILLLLARSDIATARAVLVEWSALAPSEFADHIDAMIDIQEKTFQLAGKSGGRNVQLDETVSASPDWLLVREVLNVIWPIGNGKLHPGKHELARSVIWEVKRSALDGTAATSSTDDAGYVDREIVSAALTLRHQINTLDQSLRFVEQRLHKYQVSDDMSDATWKREDRLERIAYFPLRRWRQELERRLEHGDYRPWNRTMRRATGPVHQVPVMPVFNQRMNLVRRTLMLARAAKQLGEASR